MLIAFSVCLMIIGLVLMRRIPRIAEKKMKPWLIGVGAVVFLAGCVLLYLVQSGKLG